MKYACGKHNIPCFCKPRFLAYGKQSHEIGPCSSYAKGRGIKSHLLSDLPVDFLFSRNFGKYRVYSALLTLVYGKNLSITTGEVLPLHFRFNTIVSCFLLKLWSNKIIPRLDTNFDNFCSVAFVFFSYDFL